MDINYHFHKELDEAMKNGIQYGNSIFPQAKNNKKITFKGEKYNVSDLEIELAKILKVKSVTINT